MKFDNYEICDIIFDPIKTDMMSDLAILWKQHDKKTKNINLQMDGSWSHFWNSFRKDTGMYHD